MTFESTVEQWTDRTTPPQTSSPQIGAAEVIGFRAGVGECWGAIVLRVRGDIDLASAADWDAALNDATARAVPPQPVVVDLVDTGFLGCCGVQPLRAAHERAAANGTPLRVVLGSPILRRMLALTGLDRELTLVTSVSHGIATPATPAG